MTQAQEIAIAELFASIRRHDAVRFIPSGNMDLEAGFAVVEVATVESAIADFLAADNPEFDRRRFLMRCSDTRSHLTPTEW